MIHDIEPNPSPAPTLQTQIDRLAERVEELETDNVRLWDYLRTPTPPPAPAPDFIAVPDIDESLVDLVTSVASDRVPSKGAARRLIAQGGVRMDGDMLHVGKRTYQIPPPAPAPDEAAIGDIAVILAREFTDGLLYGDDPGLDEHLENVARRIIALGLAAPADRVVCEKLIASHARLTEAIDQFMEPIKEMSGAKLSSLIGVEVHPLALAATRVKEQWEREEVVAYWTALARAEGEK